MPAILMSSYCAANAAVVLLLKQASLRQEFYWICFVAANLLTAAGLWLFTESLRYMNPNIAMAVGIGGTFITGQTLLVLVFGSRLSLAQVVGLGLILLGILVVVFMTGGPKSLA